MSRLSVRCVVTQHDGCAQRSRRDIWIEAQDFRQLALAATAQLRAPPERCAYALFAPNVGKAFVGVLLEVVRDEGWSALVGPMGGPTVPASLGDDRTCTLDELIALLGFDAGAERRGVYQVLVAYAGLLGPLGNVRDPPRRDPKESRAAWRARCAMVERRWLERGRYEGFHAVCHDVPAAEWQATDLEALLGQTYALLPAPEPRWRESGTITQEPFVPGEAAAGAIRCSLEVQRGDFVAHVRLPAFPALALAEWLASRRCEIHLRHPLKGGMLLAAREVQTRYSAA